MRVCGGTLICLLGNLWDFCVCKCLIKCLASHEVYALERDSVNLCVFRGERRRLQRSQSVEELPARESRRFRHKGAGENVCPKRLSYMCCRGVGAVLELELLEDAVLSERDAIMQGEVKKLGLVFLEAAERLRAFEEEQTASEGPEVSRTHGPRGGADDLRRGVGCRSVDARVLVVEVAELDEHLAVRPCDEDVGGAEVAVVHAAGVQVVDAVRDGEGDVELGVASVGLAGRQVLLQRDVHCLHAHVAAFDGEDAHHVGMLRDLQELCGCLHCGGSGAALELSHRTPVGAEEHAGLAALEVGLSIFLHAGEW